MRDSPNRVDRENKIYKEERLRGETRGLDHRGSWYNLTNVRSTNLTVLTSSNTATNDVVRNVIYKDGYTTRYVQIVRVNRLPL